MNTKLCRTLCLLPLLASNAQALAPPAEGGKTLWVSDDVQATIYHVALDGTILSSFHSGSISEVALGIGADEGTLWAAKEGSNQILHFDASGATLSSFPGTTYDPAAFAPEGVAVDFSDGTLWIVDDLTDLVYHVEDDGTLLTSFSTVAADPAAISPQGIAPDPTDGTLWLTDNVAHRVFQLDSRGLLVSSFPASAFGPVTLNLQGIAVDDDGSLWITARNTHAIYHVSRTGGLISTLDTALFGSLDPTGVDVAPATAWIDVGAALAGVDGEPALEGSGSLLPGTLVGLSLTHAAPSAPALIVLGLSAIQAPFKGGVLVPDADVVATLATNASGAIELSGTWPAKNAAGIRLWLQYWIVDAAGPAGFAASNALLASSPGP